MMKNNNSNKSFIDRLFYNNKFLAVFCAVMSVVLWATVKINYSADTQRTVSDVKVNLSETSENLDFTAFFSPEDLLVDVEISGKAYNINAKALTKDDIVVEASNTFVDSAGYKSVSLTARVAETATGDFEITKITPSTITVYYDRKITDTFNVVARIENNLDVTVKEGFTLGEAVPSMSTVEVTGPATILGGMKNVYFDAVIDESKLPLASSEELSAKLSYPVSRESDSKFLTCKSIDDEANPATVTIPVYATKTVPVTVKFINQPKGMDTPDYNIYPSEVEITYNPKDEEKFTEFSAGTIDFKKLDNKLNSFTVEVDPEKIPVKLTDKEITEFEIDVDMSGYSKTTVSYSVANVLYLNKQEGMVYSLEEGNGPGEITVIGPREYIGKIKSDDIRIEINVSALNVSRARGQMLDANITVDNSKLKNCWVYGEYSAFVLAMTEAEAAAAMATTTQKAE